MFLESIENTRLPNLYGFDKDDPSTPYPTILKFFAVNYKRGGVLIYMKLEES